MTDLSTETRTQDAAVAHVDKARAAIETRRADAQTKAHRLLRDAETEAELMAALGEAGAPLPWLFHHTELYGTQCSWTYGGTSLESYAALTTEQAAAIVEALPPMAKAYARGSYRYFVPLALESEFIAAREANGREEITEFFEVLPWHVSADGFAVKVKYFTLLAGRVCEISLYMAKGSHLGGFAWRGNVHHYAGNGPVSHIDGRRAEVSGRSMAYTTQDIRTEAGEWCGQFETPIIYAQGSRDSLGQCRIYGHLAPDTACTVTDFIESLKGGRDGE